MVTAKIIQSENSFILSDFLRILLIILLTCSRYYQPSIKIFSSMLPSGKLGMQIKYTELASVHRSSSLLLIPCQQYVGKEYLSLWI